MKTDDVAHGTVGPAHRLNHHFIPERRAVLAIVAQQHAAGLPARDRLAQLRTAFLFAIQALQTAQVLPHQFTGSVTRQALEGGIGIHQRLVGVARLADHDAVGRRVQHPGQKFHCPLAHFSYLPPASAPSDLKVSSGGGEALRSNHSRALCQAAEALRVSKRYCLRPRMRTRRSCEAGSISSLRRSSNRSTPGRSLQTGTTSQPAARARCARCTRSPIAAAPSMVRSSANTRPPNCSSVRNKPSIQRREKLAGTESTAGYSTWATITAGRPLAIRRRYGSRSSSMSTSWRRSTGSARCESATTAPWPG